PGVPVSVKLVAVENIGTIAVGVAKAGADVIEIDGIDGGTGAAMASSKEHSGLPSEMGLAEAHQALVLNGLRKSVKLRVGGGIKNGYDIVKYCLLGADQFSFGQALMDVSKFLHPEMALSRLDSFPVEQVPPGTTGVCEIISERGKLNDRIVEAARDAIEAATNADLMFRIKNNDRAAGATVAGLIA